MVNGLQSVVDTSRKREHSLKESRGDNGSTINGPRVQNDISRRGDESVGFAGGIQNHPTRQRRRRPPVGWAQQA